MKKQYNFDINAFIDAHDRISRNLRMLESLLKYTDSEYEFLYGISGVLTEYLSGLRDITNRYLTNNHSDNR